MKRFVVFLAFILSTTCAWAQVISPPQFAQFDPDSIPQNTDWATEVTGIYNYVNSNIVTPYNVLTTKGDLYVYNGATLGRLGVGANGTYLTVTSSAPFTPQWSSLFINTLGVTQAGTLITLNSSNVAVQIPPGPDGDVLVVDTTDVDDTDGVSNDGIEWVAQSMIATPVPVGCCMPWSPAAYGSNTVPTNWALCDGGTYTNSNNIQVVTPNLIGMFVISGRPLSSTSSPNPNGFGAEPTDTVGSGTVSHTHTAPLAKNITVNHEAVSNHGGNTNVNFGNNLNLQGTYSYPYQIPPVDSNHTLVLSNIVTNSGSLEPADYSLVYICRIQ